ETPPNPSSTVPFLRDPDYVDRDGLLERVSTKCSIPASRTALVGLGGVGKSQVAIEFSYHVRDQSPDTWVFWVHATNATRIEQSYREIADRVKIPSRKDSEANIYNLVHSWLSDQSKRRWFLILDNLDDYRVLNEVRPTGQDRQESALSRPLLTYLPQSENGSILVTTRSTEVAERFVERSAIIKVQPMDEAHAIALFEKKLGKQSNSKDVAELAGALEFMPLAIVQAAAYISQRAPRSSVQQYLEEFRKSDRKKTSLLNHEAGHLRRDWEAKNSIITTWQISFDHVCQVRASAADLLSLMSFFDRQGIPETLIRCRDLQQKHRKLGGSDVDNEEENDHNTSESTDDDEFEEDILTLRSYSFISANADQITFEMHRLVQLATQLWLVSHARLERWKRQFINNLNFAFPIGNYENWERCQSLFPHAKSAIAQRPGEADSLREWASLLHKAAWYALERGNMNDAEKMSEHAMKAREKIFGRDQKGTLASMAILTSTYRNQGRWDEAEKLEVEVIEMSKSRLGADHPSTLANMANLASTYRTQGRWDEAEKLEVELLETCKTNLGADHLDTLTSMNNLAATYWNQGRWDEAEKLQVEVIETRKTKLGADHPDTVDSIGNLAATYRNQGRWDEAEKLEVEVIETRKTKLGADHPDTVASIGNLASTYSNQGRWDEAEKLEVEVMETRKTNLGADHPDTLTSMNNLAATYWNQGRWDEAEKLQVEVIETRKTKLGADHPDTLGSIGNLVATYWNQGRWDEAEKLQVEVMETRKTRLGAHHPHTLTSMNNLAFTWKSHGRDTDALKLMEECVQLRTQILGPNHPDAVSSSAALSLWQAE
ncbi:hypothetical protein OIDMADRAFT_108651, partial [Oidiodendron maius Zn]